MTKGLLIFFIVLIVIAIIHFVSLRIMQIAEEKKMEIQKSILVYIWISFCNQWICKYVPF